MISPFSVFPDLKKDSRDRAIAVAASVFLHIILLVFAIVFSGYSHDSRRLPSVIDVDIISFSAPAHKKQTENKKKKLIKTKKKLHRKSAHTKRKKKTILPGKKKKIKKIKKNKKKLVNSKNIINDAIKRLQKDLEKTRPEPLVQRMKQLEKEIIANERELADNADKSVQGPEKIGGNSKLIAQYVSYVKVAVQENWAFSEALAGGGRQLETRILVKVMPDGEIKGVKIIKKSGNDYMDSAASVAVVKTSPVAPFPTGINRAFIEIDLGFSPQ